METYTTPDRHETGAGDGLGPRWRWPVAGLAALPTVGVLLLLAIALRARVEFGMWPQNPFAAGSSDLPSAQGYYAVHGWLTHFAVIAGVYSALVAPPILLLSRRRICLAVYVVGWIVLGLILGSDAGFVAWFFD